MKHLIIFSLLILSATQAHAYDAAKCNDYKQAYIEAATRLDALRRAYINSINEDTKRALILRIQMTETELNQTAELCDKACAN